MAPKKFTYTPGTGGGARTKALAAKGAESKTQDRFGPKTVNGITYVWDPTKMQYVRQSAGTSGKFNLNSTGMGSSGSLSKQVKGTTDTLNEITGVAPAQRIAQGKGSKADIAMTAMSVLPVGKAVGLVVKGGKAAVSGIRGAEAVASTAEAGTKAASIKPIEGLARTTVRKPVQTQASINKQRRAGLEKIAEKTGQPRTKIGAERGVTTPKAEPKKAPPTVPPTKGVAIKTEATPGRGAQVTPKKVIPEEYRASGPTGSLKSNEVIVKEFKTPKPNYNQFKVDGKYGDAEKAAFKAANKKWNASKKAFDKRQAEAADKAAPSGREGTPLEKMREDAAKARQQAAGGDIARAGREKGTPERKFQDKQRGQENPNKETKELMRGPEGSNPRKAASLPQKTRFSARPTTGTRPPSRSRYKTQANYDKAYAKWQAKDTSALPSKPTNVAETAAPKAPSRKGGFKETGFRYRFEGKTGKAGEPKMTKRPKLREEPFVSAPEKPAPAAAKPVPSPKKPSTKSKAKTKPAEETPVAAEATAARPAAMKSPTKAGASKTKFRPGMKAPSKATEAAPAPKAPAAKKPKPAEEAPKETPVAKKPAAKKEEAAGARPKRPTAKQSAQAQAAREAYDAALKSGDPGRIRAARAKWSEFKKTKQFKIAAGSVVGASGALGVGGAIVGQPPGAKSNKPKETYQAGANNGRLSRLTVRKAQVERAATSAKPAAGKKFGAAGESKFIKGRSAVRQSVIDQINKQGMTKSLAAVKSHKNDPEYLEAIRRYYGAKRLKQALKG
jgi:hypothetical protein